MRHLGPVLLASTLFLAGCGLALGVEDVVLDDGAGGAGGAADITTVTSGGHGGRPPTSDATSNGSVGAGISTGSPASSSTSGEAVASSSADASSSSSGPSSGPSGPAGSSSSGGGGCVGPRPACAGAVASGFQSDADLDLGWMIEAPKAKIGGGKLELDPDGAEAASVRSVLAVQLAGSCAVWITRQEGNDGATALALTDDDGEGEPLAVVREEGTVTAFVEGSEVGSIAASDGDARFLRIRIEAEGAYLEVAANRDCWETVAGPVAVAGARKVRLAFDGDGKAKLDDYCID